MKIWRLSTRIGLNSNLLWTSTDYNTKIEAETIYRNILVNEYQCIKRTEKEPKFKNSTLFKKIFNVISNFNKDKINRDEHYVFEMVLRFVEVPDDSIIL